MPIYEFICRRCGLAFEELTPANWRESGVVCPICHSAELERAVSRVGGFSSGGKMQVLGEAPACASCHSSACSSCHK